MNTDTLSRDQVFDLIRPFCGRLAVKAHYRDLIIRSGFAYATDRAALVRVEAVGATDTHGGPTFHDLEGVLAVQLPVEWEAMRAIPERETVECYQCQDGQCECSCGHVHGCENCGATGKEEVRLFVEIGHRKFDAKYLRLIAALPGVMVAPDSGTATEKMPFKFDFGIGAVMPILEN